MYQSASTYFDLVQETATIVADELSAANKRNIQFVKSLWEIVGRSNSESPLRGAYERAEAVVALTAKELETSLRSNLDVTEKLIAQGKKLQQQSYDSAKDMADKALANAKQIVEAASERMETLGENVVSEIQPAGKKKRTTVSE